jgi:CheY-like chemotaxis protein/HPt (histidine-containing phosphotransfer) domain-containing protein
LGIALAVARDRAERNEKIKQQFLANMSHEIRTPMNAVMGINRLLLEKQPRHDQLRYLNGIRKASDNLLHIVNDILDISKIESGKMELETVDFSLRDVIGQVAEVLSHKAAEKGIALLTDLDDDMSDVYIGDPLRLSQVLMNLAGNAVKFTSRGTVIIQISQAGGAQGIRFSVADTGIGIPTEKLETIFESFTQATNSDTRNYGGTGLGLTISRQLVELMGGRLEVESTAGAGSVFTFTLLLPVGSPARLKHAEEGTSVDASALAGLRVLVVDDHEYNRMVARDTLLSKAAVHVEEAANGREAIEKLRHASFDLVLMDVQMPEMDGYEATKHIRAHLPPPKNAVPVIALTASVIRSDLDKCLEAGMNDYVPKPFGVVRLLTSIAKHTGRNLYVREAYPEKQPDHAEVNGLTDLTYLRSFCENDPERIKKYIRIFLESVPVVADKIKAAAAEREWIHISSQAHGVKTKLNMMGMSGTRDLATRIELACRMPVPDANRILKLTNRFVADILAAEMELRTQLAAF